MNKALSVFVAFSLLVGSVQADIVTGLKMHLRAESGTGTTAVDSTGLGHSGTLTNGVAWIAGKVGAYAFDFDGTDDYVTIPTHADLYPAAITVALWVKADTWTGNGNTALIAKNDNNAPSYPSYDIRRKAFASGEVQVSIGVGGTAYLAEVPSLTTGVWTHIAFTYDGETLTLYKNGVAGTPNTTPSGNLASSAAALWLGGNATFAAGRYFDGKEDDIRIYNRALSGPEIVELVNAATFTASRGRSLNRGGYSGSATRSTTVNQ